MKPQALRQAQKDVEIIKKRYYETPPRGVSSYYGFIQTKQMAVQQEIKSQLAKLLATEDIVVEHKQVDSAQFNVRTRVLILPLMGKSK